MFRITAVPALRSVVVRVEGRLTGAAGSELETLCARLRRDATVIRLDLRGLSFADPHGVAALCRELARGAEAVGASSFVQSLLEGCP